MCNGYLSVGDGTNFVPQAARTMARRGVHRLPAPGVERRLVDMVTRGDLLKVLPRPDEETEREVREDAGRAVRPEIRVPGGGTRVRDDRPGTGHDPWRPR